jgi:hypothetical protein
LADARDRAQAQKRGGGEKLLSLDDAEAEARYQLEPCHEASPDRLFDCRWAYALLATVMARLDNEFHAAGKESLFQELKPFLIGQPGEGAYARAAERLKMTEAAAKMAATRVRKQYRQLLRAEVAKTVEDPAEIESELRYLFSILG